MRLLLAAGGALLVADENGGGRLDTRLALEGRSTQCLALDPVDPRRVYCGTFGDGLWRSEDGGESWQPVPGLTERQITAVAVSSTERAAGSGVVYAGSEPSRVFRSEDGGATWEERRGLEKLPSAARWSFPPRPHTHHVRWITPDPNVSGRLWVAIEAGALIRTEDAGASWHDRVPGGPYDTHTLAAPPNAPARLCSAAGDGYYESADGGATWTQPEQGLGHRYLWGVAVDPRDPRLVIVSAASGPLQAHDASAAESHVYRCVDGGDWEELSRGLPAPRGTTIGVLAADPGRAGAFYTANNHGLFRSDDRGDSWQLLDLAWPDRFRRQRVAALLVLHHR